MAVDLPAERQGEAFSCIAAWRADPDAVRTSPVCAARPYAEWYVLSCPACGLKTKLQIPLRGP